MESMQSVNKDELEYNEEELKSLEKLNLRREARRRKILENAKNRLERLNGRTGTAVNASTITATKTTDGNYEHHGSNHLDGVEFSDPEVEPDIIPQQQLLQNEQPLDIGNLFSSLNTETTLPQQKRHIILRARLHLIISALVSCILTFAPLSESTSSSFKIFIPAGLCVIIDLLFFREQQPLNPIVNLIIVMCNIRLPKQTKNILHLLSIIQSLIVDLGVFIFSFCIFSCGLVYMKNNINNLIQIK